MSVSHNSLIDFLEVFCSRTLWILFHSALVKSDWVEYPIQAHDEVHAVQLLSQSSYPKIYREENEKEKGGEGFSTKLVYVIFDDSVSNWENQRACRLSLQIQRAVQKPIRPLHKPANPFTIDQSVQQSR